MPDGDIRRYGRRICCRKGCLVLGIGAQRSRWLSRYSSNQRAASCSHRTLGPAMMVEACRCPRSGAYRTQLACGTAGRVHRRRRRAVRRHDAQRRCGARSGRVQWHAGGEGGRGNAEGMVPPNANTVFISGNNLTATKARLLLMACLMKYGALPPAADSANPTSGERDAVKEKLALYEEAFRTH